MATLSEPFKRAQPIQMPGQTRVGPPQLVYMDLTALLLYCKVFTIMVMQNFMKFCLHENQSQP